MRKWIIFWGLVIFSFACKQGVETASQPLQEQAKEHYLKARRLFLTCNPDNYLKAIEEYNLALEYWDEYPEALAGLAEAISMWRGYSISEEEFGKAYQYAQRALRLNPDLADGYRAMADLFRHRRDYERALRLIETAIELDPDNAENLYVKGSALLAINPQEAARVLIEAQKLNPELPKIYFNLASAAQKLGEYDRALSLLEKYQKMVPSDISAHCSIGMVLLSKRSQESDPEIKKQLLDQAIEKFKTVSALANIKKKPWQTSWVLLSYKTLANIYLEDKQYQTALDWLKKAEGITDQDPHIYYLYGMVYKAQGKKSLAKKYLKKALELSPDSEEIKKELEKL